MRKNDAGNVIFMILIACALFAALAYAVTQSGRSSSNSTREKAMLDAAQRVQFGYAITQAIAKMKLAIGCEDNEIDFTGHNNTSYNVDNVPYDYTNPNSPTDGSCNVFSRAGGNVIPRDFTTIKTGLIEPAAAGAGVVHPHSWGVLNMRVLGAGSDAATSAGTDLVLASGRLTIEQCLNFNVAMGVTNTGGVPPTDAWDCSNIYVGTYPACANPIGDAAPEIRGKQDFCLRVVSPDDRFYQIHLLLAR